MTCPFTNKSYRKEETNALLKYVVFNTGKKVQFGIVRNFIIKNI